MGKGARTGKLGLGILGTGNIADMNVAGYLEHPDCDVVAVCDVDAALAEEAAKRWDVPRAYSHIDELLGDDDIDAVEILTPTHLHYAHVKAALEAGKHVSVQKPITNSVDEALELGKLADDAGLTLRVSECFVHYPPLEKAKELISEGSIGRPISVRIRTVVGQTDSPFQAALRPEGYGWRLDKRSPGGHLFDDNVHKYAMALWLVEPDIISVQAVVRRRDIFFEPCAVIFEYDDPDLLGTMEVQYARDMWMRSGYFGADEFFEIQGEEGFLWVTRATGEMLDLPPVVLYQGKDNARTFTEFDQIDADWATGFRRSSAHFVEALRSGSPAAMTAKEAAKVLQLCFAVYQASDTRQPVDPRTITGSVTPAGWAEW